MSGEVSSVLDFLGSEITGLYRFIKILGISRRELDVYALILTSGGLTANEISDILGLPLSKVYESLSSLLSRKWIFRTSDRPARYYAVPVTEVWEEIKKTINEQIREVEEKILPLLESLSRSPVPLLKIVLLDQSKIPSFVRRILSRGEGEVYVSLAYRELLDPTIVSDLKKAAIGRRVKVLVSQEVYGDFKKTGLNEVAEYRVVDKLFGSGVIGEEVLIILKSSGVMQGLWSDHYYFVELGRVYFNHLWQKP